MHCRVSRDHSKGKLHGHISKNTGTQVHILASLAAFTLVSHGTLSRNHVLPCLDETFEFKSSPIARSASHQHHWNTSVQ